MLVLLLYGSTITQPTCSGSASMSARSATTGPAPAPPSMVATTPSVRRATRRDADRVQLGAHQLARPHLLERQLGPLVDARRSPDSHPANPAAPPRPAGPRRAPSAPARRRSSSWGGGRTGRRRRRRRRRGGGEQKHSAAPSR